MRIHRIRKFPTKLFVLLLILIIAFNPKVFPVWEKIALEILLKPFKFLSAGRMYFTRLSSLYEQNLLLKQRVASLSVSLARMKDIALENKRLRALSGFKKDLDYKTIIAKIIVRDLSDWRRGIVINKGRIHGVKKHMACATASGLIGSVTEVGPAWSKIMLITDANSRVGVVLGPSRESGVLVGSSEDTCKVIYLSLDASFNKGDKVLTAGFSTFFPSGLAVGEVKEIGIDKTRLYKYAIVEPSVDMGKLEEVLCIDTGK